MTLGSYVKLMNEFLEKNENLVDHKIKHRNDCGPIEQLPPGKYLIIHETLFNTEEIIVKKL